MNIHLESENTLSFRDDSLFDLVGRSTSNNLNSRHDKIAITKSIPRFGEATLVSPISPNHVFHETMPHMKMRSPKDEQISQMTQEPSFLHFLFISLNLDGIVIVHNECLRIGRFLQESLGVSSKCRVILV
jgi:hypothetical protein